MDMVKLQHVLKNNSTDIQTYVEDLDSWQSEMTKKDKSKDLRAQTKGLNAKAAAARASMPLPPIRNKVDIKKHQKKTEGDIFSKEEANKNSEKVNKLKRDITPMFDYYKSWDKFTKEEVDKEEEPASDFIPAQQATAIEQPAPQSQAEMMKRTSGAKPNTKMVIKGGTIKQSSQADTLKLQGNAFFLSLEYDKAIDCYTRCITHIDESNHSLLSIVYSNRA